MHIRHRIIAPAVVALSTAGILAWLGGHHRGHGGARCRVGMAGSVHPDYLYNG